MAFEAALVATSEDSRGKIAESTQRKGNVSVIALGADHAGFALKQVIIQHLLGQAHEVVAAVLMMSHGLITLTTELPSVWLSSMAMLSMALWCVVAELELLWQLEKCLVFGQRPFTTRQLLP